MLLRNVSRLRNHFFHSRWKSTKSSPRSDEVHDFRPPWVYTTSRLINFTVIPGVLLYSMFFYDFGEGEHVFRPVRRWAQEQKAAFLTLSPDEKRVLEAILRTLHNDPNYRWVKESLHILTILKDIVQKYYHLRGWELFP